MKNIRILTFNAGLLSFADPLVVPAAHVEERFSELPEALATNGSDIILLQEVFERRHVDTLIRTLHGVYPHHLAPTGARWWGNKGHGLMIFSKIPFQSSTFTPFDRYCFEEGLLVQKGFQIVRLNVLGVGVVSLTNTHLVSGGFNHPESEEMNRIRTNQIEQLIAALPNGTYSTTVLAGDLNAGPEASPENFQAILGRGYADPLNGEAVPNCVTWDNTNPLNAKGPQRKCPSQRIDHILTRGNVRTMRSQRVFTEPFVKTNNGARATLSDHYGVESELSFH